MATLTVTAKITKPVITEIDKRALCIALVTQLLGAEYVQKLSQQGQSQTDTTITPEQRSISYA